MRKNAEIQFELKDYDYLSKNDLLFRWATDISYLENHALKENLIITQPYGKNYLKLLSYWREEYRDE